MISFPSREEINQDSDLTVILEDDATKKVFALAKSVASTPSTILLSGESGAGKEVFARFIHRHSGKEGRSFVGVNCAAFSESLLESELFGHEKGSFSGAMRQHMGVFERANGGTLLLDEVSEMPLDLQAKLLRVIQERRLTRVGGTEEIEVDIRIIATTNRNLREYVDEGGFRHDLYYRLNVFPIKIPALRERKKDIKPLTIYYGASIAKMFGKDIRGITREALERLEGYPFPGNVRELINLVERAVIICGESQILEAEHFYLDGEGQWDQFQEPTLGFSSLMENTDIEVDIVDEMKVKEGTSGKFTVKFRAGDKLLTEIRREVIISTLKRFDGNQVKAAEALGITARTIRNKLKDYENREE